MWYILNVVQDNLFKKIKNVKVEKNEKFNSVGWQ